MSNTLLKTAFLTTRPPFLLLTPICVFLGLSTALKQTNEVNLLLACFILIGAIFAHVSVNMLNEYYDFKSGLDLKTDKTPFSGGSGALPNHPAAAPFVLNAGLVSLFITVAVGIYLMVQRGSLIFPIGIAGVVLVVTYTQWVNRIPLLCLIAPGLGFGILMVLGTHIILVGDYNPLAWQLSLIPFLLINNLLLLNQFPDITADANVGRRTLPIVYGPTASSFIYILFALSSYALIVYYVLAGNIPKLSLIALIPMIFAGYAGIGAMKYGADIGWHSQYLAANVVAALLTPLLLGIGVLLG